MSSAALRARGILAATLLAATSIAACTSEHGGPTTAPSTLVTTRTITQTLPASSPPSGPIKTGPTTSAAAGRCPLIDARFPLAKAVGLRLDRITVQRSDGKVVGCRIYALQHPNPECDATCLAKENLPPAKLPAVEITTTRYPSAGAAHNGFVRAAGKAKNAQTPKLGSELGVCFETNFWAKHNGTDWACSFRVASTAVLVRTVVIKSALNVIEVSREVAGKL